MGLLTETQSPARETGQDQSGQERYLLNGWGRSKIDAIFGVGFG